MTWGERVHNFVKSLALLACRLGFHEWRRYYSDPDEHDKDVSCIVCRKRLVRKKK
jgi:hypothetical protein